MNKEGMFLGASPLIFERARELRSRETIPEKLLWKRLSKKQLGVKFRRQHPIHCYIADFYCHTHKLIVEIDGVSHDGQEQSANDKVRDKSLSAYGIETLRFSNEMVLNNIEQVVQRIMDHIAIRSAHPSP